MNDSLLEFCIYNIMYDLMTRGIEPCIAISKVIKYVEFIAKDKEVFEEAYSDTLNDKINEESEDEYDVDDFDDLELWEEDEITPLFIHSKIESFVYANSDYFEIDKRNYLKLNKNISFDDLQDVYKESSEEVCLEYIDFISSNLDLLKIIGINLREDIAKLLLNSEREIQKLYLGEDESSDPSLLNCYLYGDDNSGVIKKIKKALFKNMVYYVNCLNSLSESEYKDLDIIVNSYKEIDDEHYPLHYDTLIDRDAIDVPMNSFLDAIFYQEDDSILMTTSKINLQRTLNTKEAKNKKTDDEKNFWLAYLYFLDEEIKKMKDEEEEFIECLIAIKYRLIRALDSIYGTSLFVNPNSYNFDINIGMGDPFTYVLIDDILCYKDIEYSSGWYGKVGLVNRLNNIVKKIFIMTDYFVSSDETIPEHILQNDNYGKNTISSEMLDDVIKFKKIDRKKILERRR